MNSGYMLQIFSQSKNLKFDMKTLFQDSLVATKIYDAAISKPELIQCSDIFFDNFVKFFYVVTQDQVQAVVKYFLEYISDAYSYTR